MDPHHSLSARWRDDSLPGAGSLAAVSCFSRLSREVRLPSAAGSIAFSSSRAFRASEAAITKLSISICPSRGFAAELATATTVVGASSIGLPISTTHTLVGAVLGVGLARGIGALNLRVVGTIFTSWVVTLPAGAFLAIIYFFTLTSIFG